MLLSRLIELMFTRLRTLYLWCRKSSSHRIPRFPRPWSPSEPNIRPWTRDLQYRRWSSASRPRTGGTGICSQILGWQEIERKLLLNTGWVRNCKKTFLDTGWASNWKKKKHDQYQPARQGMAREECSLLKAYSLRPRAHDHEPRGASHKCHHEEEFHLLHAVFGLILISWSFKI